MILVLSFLVIFFGLMTLAFLLGGRVPFGYHPKDKFLDGLLTYTFRLLALMAEATVRRDV